MNDGLTEEPETFSISLLQPINATIGDGEAVLTIEDGFDEPQPPPPPTSNSVYLPLLFK